MAMSLFILFVWKPMIKCSHARQTFSSPYSGTIENAVTGTASGVMGAFYTKYINTNFETSLNLVVEQG